MNFIEYLINNGFKAYRKIYENKHYVYVPETNQLNYFSSCVPGYLDIRLIKDNMEIIYGLHEYKHPPCLIYPKLANTDAQVDRIFQTNTYGQILKAIINSYSSQ